MAQEDEHFKLELVGAVVSTPPYTNPDFHNVSMANILDQCQVCGKQGKVLRCSRCKAAHYCSIECQKGDWKAGHRRKCLATNIEARATQALHELYSMTQGISVPEAKQRQDQASDLLEKQLQQDLLKKTMIRFPKKTESETVTDESTTNDLPKQKNPHAYKKESRSQSIKINNTFFFLEEMKNIHQFQASLRPKCPLNQESFQLVVKAPTGSEGFSQIKFHSTDEIDMEFSIHLPRRLIPDQCSWNLYKEDDTIQLRLPFQESMTDPDLIPLESLAPVDVINRIQCRQCHQVLLPSKPIERTYFLPKGNWEEIVDYLSCFSGQPVIDFSSSADVQPLTAAQDANALCFHASDLGTTVCVLAVSGYGESSDVMATSNDNNNHNLTVPNSAVVRGNRMWQDAAGGATICCTQCCAVLGFASLESPETFRLLKHRLLVGNGGDAIQGLLSSNTNITTTDENMEWSSCASFLAREMVRYAESKAIFTFIIGVDRESPEAVEQNHKMCLLLRLVSWDTAIATEASVNGLKFQNVAKVVYEEVVDEMIGNTNSKNNTENKNEEDPSQWVWGGVDLCCILPGVKEEETGTDSHHNPVGKVSTVRLQLPVDEYETVKKDLQTKSNLFPKSIKDATILMKMGPKAMGGNSNNMDLTVIQLR